MSLQAFVINVEFVGCRAQDYDSSHAMDLFKKSDPIGEWFGRHLLEPLVNHFLPTEEDKKRAVENIQRYDPLVRLGISPGPPEMWKSLLWWGILIVGTSLAWYTSAHLK